MPALHPLWDLRFTDIRYLPRPDPAAPQRFVYETRIGFGLSIEGEGETVAAREDASGARTSALKCGCWSSSYSEVGTLTQKMSVVRPARRKLLA